MAAPDKPDVTELMSLGLKFIGAAAKQFGRETAEDARSEAQQVKDAWADVVDKVKPAERRAAPETASPSPRDDLLFGLLNRGVTALETIAASMAPATTFRVRTNGPRYDGPEDTSGRV